MLSAIAFVPRGAAKAVPEKNELSPEELDMLVKQGEAMSLEEGVDAGAEGDLAEAEMAVGEEDNEPRQQTTLTGDAFMDQLNMDDYDNEPEGAEVFLAGSNLSYHSSNQEDPHITNHEDGVDEEEEEDDLTIRDTDKLFLVGRTEEEHSTLEVYVYEEDKGTMYAHHDFALPSFPLCMEWMNQDPRAGQHGEAANMVAVGTFKAGIEIWNLDVLDVLEPVATLGGRQEPEQAQVEAIKAKYGKQKGIKNNKAMRDALLGNLREGSHADAVMSLAWHKTHRARLASGSADNTVKLWDLTTQRCVNTLSHHTNKVQALQWNPAEPSILLSGSYDRTVAIQDIRDAKSVRRTPLLDADVESACWNPTLPMMMAVSTESGMVSCFDVRKLDTPLWSLGAHNMPCTSVSFSSAHSNLMATSGVDKTVKLWSIEDNKPNMLASKDMQIGPIFSMGFDIEMSTLLVCGGNKGKVAVWDVRQTLAGKAQQQTKKKKKGKKGGKKGKKKGRK